MIFMLRFCAKILLYRTVKRFFCAMFQNLKVDATKRTFFATTLMTGLLREEKSGIMSLSAPDQIKRAAAR